MAAIKCARFCFVCIFRTKMTQFEKQLWQKIQTFEFDEPGTKLTFANRLSRENGWNKNYTLSVIDEYKKFIFLCCTSTNPVTPSDPVDQAWHLHLTYTKSYWHNLCRDTLGKEIHHNPTKGGKKEQVKFNNLYTGLQEIYSEKFGSPPPSNIWHDNKTRFTDIDFQRVNIARNWVIKKPALNSRILREVFLIALAMLCIQAEGLGFLMVFIIIWISAHLANKKWGGKDGNNGNDGDGGTSCSSFSCSSDSHGHSGCSSHGDSGCSSSGCSSGCSGCGGGCGGGD